MSRALHGSRPTALDGLRVLEFGSVAATYAAKMLGDFGADVVKLEPEGGDRLRYEPPFVTPEDGGAPGALFRYLATNRRSVELPLGTDPLQALLTRCSVLVTDRSEDEREALGLATQALRERYPHLLVVTISPFGAVGPLAGARGGELVTYAMGGLAQCSPGLPDRAEDAYLEGPLHPGGYPAALAAGLVAAVASLALLPRDGDAPAAGRHVDVSEQAAVASLAYRYLAVTAYAGFDVDRTDAGPLNMPNLYVPCRDGYVVIAAVLDRQWERLVTALGSPAWACDPALATAAGRNTHRDMLEARLRAWCLERDGDEIVGLATTNGIPCFRFYRLEEMEKSEHVVARGSLVPVPGATTAQMPAAPFKMSRSPWALRRPAPARATSAAEILDTWGQPADSRTNGAAGIAPTSARLPLEGLRVLDFGQVLAVPFGTQWMAWLGADVILVESARHPHTRATPPFSSENRDPNTSAIFNTFNSSKRSLSVDMKTAEGQQLLADLVPHCDVVVENFRAGVLDRIGLSYDRLRELRPDIVLLSLGAFGRSGPMKDGAGLHSAANLYSGLADVTRYPGGSPRIMGACLPDPLSGLNAVAAVLLALQHRRRTGEGQFIDQAMYEGLLPWAADAIMADGPTRADMRRLGTHGEASVLRGFFPAKGQDEWIALQLDDLDDWRTAWSRLGLTTSLSDSTEPTSKDHLVLRAALTTWLSTRTADEAVRELRAWGLAVGPASTTSGVLEDEQLRAFGFVRCMDHPVSGPRWLPTLPWRMEGIDGLALRPAPLLGEHVTEVLGSLLGLGEDEIRTFGERGILS